MVTGCGVLFSAGEWADTLTNISISDIFSEASRAAETGCGKPQTASCSQSLFNFDSFDATIASHLRHTSESATNHLPIWDGEETCDGFLFRKVQTTADNVSSPIGKDVKSFCSATRLSDLNACLNKIEEVNSFFLVSCLKSCTKICTKLGFFTNVDSIHFCHYVTWKIFSKYL